VANNLQVIPSPTINFDFQELLDKIIGMLPAEASAVAAAAAADGNDPNAGAIVVIGTNNMGIYDSDNNDDANNSKIVDATNATSQPMKRIGGRTTICHLIHDHNAIHKGTKDLILKLQKQHNENDKASRIKAAFTYPHLSHAAQRMAFVIANEPSASMPVLLGLVNKTTSISTLALELHTN
jgi:hypothetical protein